MGVLDPRVELGREFGIGVSVQMRGMSVERGPQQRHVVEPTALGGLVLDSGTIHHAVVATYTRSDDIHTPS